MLVGSITNAVSVVVGSALGLLFKKGISKHFNKTIMGGLGLCLLYIGISGLSSGKQPLLIIMSIVFGALIGEALRLNTRLERVGTLIGRRFAGGSLSGHTFSQGFVSASLFYCIGSMAFMGALQDGLCGDHKILFAKSAIDVTSSVFFASSMGAGVALSALPIFLVEGGIAACAGLAAPFLTPAAIGELNCVGSVIVIGIGLNMLDITKLKLANYIPAVFFPFILSPIFAYFANLFQ
ncbi:MAG: DUF554 domain-containing protein [Candidatus Bruticola sp.]